MTKEMLVAKAKGYTASLSKMTAKQRDGDLSSTVVRDYNGLRSAVISLLPELAEAMPPEIRQHKSKPFAELDDFETYHYDANYQDLHAYTEQIANFLAIGSNKLAPTRLSR